MKSLALMVGLFSVFSPSPLTPMPGTVSPDTSNRQTIPVNPSGPRRITPQGFDVVRAYRPTTIYDSPRGKRLGVLSPQTEFGTSRVFGILRHKGDWFLTTTPAFRKPVWVKAHRSMKWTRTRFSIHVDRSRRQLTLRHGNTRVLRASVAVGRSGSSTPLGHFFIADKLSGSQYGPYYGCCILSLSTNQPHLPPGWRGGNRMALHGTNAPGSIGYPSSAGCVRLHEPPLRRLYKRVPIGTPVFIHP